MICLGLNDCWNVQFGHSVLLICFAEVVGCVPPSWLCQFVKLHLLLAKPLHAALYWFGDCADHPAGFVIFAQLALLCIIVFFFNFSSSSSLELARSLRLFPIAFSISSNVFSGSLVVNPTFSTLLISSCFCLIAVSASSTCILATAVSLSTLSSMHCSFSPLLEMWVSRSFSATSFFLDRKPRNAPRARTLSASNPLLPSFA